MNKMFISRLDKLRGNTSKNAFARKCDIKQTTMIGYLNGTSEPNLENLKKIAEACGVSVGWLADGEMHIGDALAASPKPGEAIRSSIIGKPAGQAEQAAPDIRIADKLQKTAVVLESDTSYRAVLAANIDAFHEAVIVERDKDELRERIERMENEKGVTNSRLRQLEEKLAAMESRVSETIPAEPVKKMGNGIN